MAIAGEYNASPAWRKIERDIAAEPGHAGLVIVSGLTLGIDGVAHAESLKTGTAAVPGGRIVSESPAGDKARAQDFPRRNPTSTGLTRGTVMAETAARSGSLISPQMAGKKGREVMAVPGSQLDPAPLAQTACSVRAPHWRPARRTCRSCWRGYRRFTWPRPRPGLQAGLSGQPGPANQLSRVRQTLSPLPIDEIARAAGRNGARYNGVLMELERAGEALSDPGVLVARAFQGPVAHVHRPGRQKQAGPAGWLDGPLVRL